MAIGTASGADSDIGLMLKAVRLAEASKGSEIRMRSARDVVAPLFAKALGSKRVWVSGSASAEHSRSQEGCFVHQIDAAGKNAGLW